MPLKGYMSHLKMILGSCYGEKKPTPIVFLLSVKAFNGFHFHAE